MRHEVRAFNLPLAASGSSNVVRIDDLERAGIFFGTADGVAPLGVTCKVQGKASLGSWIMNEWIDIVTITNANIQSGFRVDVPEGYTQLRVTMTGYTSGAPVASVSGKNTRTDL